MQITKNGLNRPECNDIEPIQNNVDILDNHLSDKQVHVDAATIAGIPEPIDLTPIDAIDTNDTMWGKIKKAMTTLLTHMQVVASETTLGHIKIGTGLKMLNDAANVKIANDLVTDDEETALSAKMGKELSIRLEDEVKRVDDHMDDKQVHVDAATIAGIPEPIDLTPIDAIDTNDTMWGKIKKAITTLLTHMQVVASETTLGHIKIGTGLKMVNDAANVKIANDLVTDDEETALSAKMGMELNKEIKDNTQTLLSTIKGVEERLPLRPLEQKGFVEDCFREVIEAGYYQYYHTAANKPSNVEGIIICMPWFEKNNDWNNKFNFRIAIDTDGNLFTSVYQEGVTWGTWNMK